ncbi:FAD-dependent oxidoreductase [Frankia sp. QA3]|uniref:FAD-dependent oxidoreductase n=1 Tax=Frankia sp. QA3 TaxID=710111 RepID=UPI001E496207|nr:FAD-dependent oxidoreductase [Frankia sp. QA3]
MTDLVGQAGTAVLRPELAARPAELADALVELRPHTLVVGANAVDATTLERWAAAVRVGGPVRAGSGRPDADRELLLVRRGTSLAAVDTAAAARLRITVRNTPEVNARHVARFMADRLFGAAGGQAASPAREQPTPREQGPRRPGTLGLLGAGNINGRVARAGGARGWRLVVHSPSLVADPASVGAWARHHRLAADRVHVARTVEEVLEAADAVAVAVPLVHAGPWASAGMIGEWQLKAFTGERIVSVSEPEVFAERALLDAYDRRDLTVVLDNAPRLLAPVRQLLATRIDGDGGAPRAGFTLCSAAMRSAACDDDLDQAVLAVVGRADLDELTGTDLLGPAPDRSPRSDLAATRGRVDHPGAGRDTDRRVDEDPAPDDPAVGGHGVVVVGGGIVGLTVALLLRLRGHRRVRVLDAAPADRSDPDRQGTTFGGANARHLSATETLPPADAGRAGILGRGPADGGWRLRDPASLSTAELAWAEAFDRRTDRPGLHATAQELVIALNRLGLRGWEHLFAVDGTGWLAGLRRDGRLARIYLGGADLAAGERLQRAADTGAVRLPGEVLARDWPGLGASVPLPGGVREIAGAVEVDGYAVNIHDLATALGGRLADLGVEVRAGVRVRGLDPGSHSTRSDISAGTGPGGRPEPGVRLLLDDGSVLPADRVVITTGGRDLDRLLGADWPGAGAVAHLLGLSLTLPNPGLRRPAKIHAGDPLGVMNITSSPDGTLIHVSSGFGYLGLAGREAATEGTAGLRAVAERAIAGLFPTLRRADGGLDVRDVRVCERPATPDGLPVVTALPGHAGRVLVAAGTNAGGAVQAPAVAMLVADLLDGAPRCAGLAMAGDRIGLPHIPEITLCASE